MIVADINKLSHFYLIVNNYYYFERENNYHFYLTSAQLLCFRNGYYFIINTLYVKKDIVCFECGSVLSSDYELNDHIMKYHRRIRS
jgi:hypothetical protein